MLFLSAFDLTVLVPNVVVKKNKYSHDNDDKISKKAPAIRNISKKEISQNRGKNQLRVIVY